MTKTTAKLLQFDGAYIPEGAGGRWLEPAFATVDRHNRLLAALQSERPRNGPRKIERVKGYLIPSFANGHSHAFQFAMAGQAENLARGHEEDDFWTWRSRMYELSLSLNPDEIQSWATAAYREMKIQGYGQVAEFHYLCNDPQGKPYKNPALLMEAHVAAAKTAGIDLCLIPVFYQQGGFEQSALPEQCRFVMSSLDEYWKHLESAQKLAKKHPHVTAGGGLHSLRAVKAQDVKIFFRDFPKDLPLHLHIAEQMAEVRDCQSHWGARPVQWLLENVELHSRCHLVHATHIDAQELHGLVRSQAQVVLCPSTEGNLGDGFFPLRDFFQAGGCFTIGSDSQIGLSPLEELRWLDYGQRLRLQKRNVLCQQADEESGELLFNRVIRSGRSSVGLRPEWLQKGDTLKGLLLNPKKLGQARHRLSQLIYSGNASWFKNWA